MLNIFGATVAFTNRTRAGLNQTRVLLDSRDSRMRSYASFFRLSVEQVARCKFMFLINFVFYLSDFFYILFYCNFFFIAIYYRFILDFEQNILRTTLSDLNLFIYCTIHIGFDHTTNFTDYPIGFDFYIHSICLDYIVISLSVVGQRSTWKML